MTKPALSGNLSLASTGSVRQRGKITKQSIIRSQRLKFFTISHSNAFHSYFFHSILSYFIVYLWCFCVLCRVLCISLTLPVSNLNGRMIFTGKLWLLQTGHVTFEWPSKLLQNRTDAGVTQICVGFVFPSANCESHKLRPKIVSAVIISRATVTRWNFHSEYPFAQSKGAKHKAFVGFWDISSVAQHTVGIDGSEQDGSAWHCHLWLNKSVSLWGFPKIEQQS